MFEALETRGQALSWAVAIAIIFIGNMLGGHLLGMIPLGLAVGAGIFLWVKEVIRSGRGNEWKSERDRGESATANLIPESVEVSTCFIVCKTRNVSNAKSTSG